MTASASSTTSALGVLWAYLRRRVGRWARGRGLPYIQRNLDATRKAFALDHVATTEYAAAERLPAAALHADQVTVDNIRLWEPSVLKIAIQNLQAIGQYYEFSDVDVDR